MPGADQVVRGIGEEGMPFVIARLLRRRIRRRDELSGTSLAAAKSASFRMVLPNPPERWERGPFRICDDQL